MSQDERINDLVGLQGSEALFGGASGTFRLGGGGVGSSLRRPGWRALTAG